jgi:hypothetical protein
MRTIVYSIVLILLLIMPVSAFVSGPFEEAEIAREQLAANTEVEPADPCTTIAKLVLYYNSIGRTEDAMLCYKIFENGCATFPNLRAVRLMEIFVERDPHAKEMYKYYHNLEK